MEDARAAANKEEIEEEEGEEKEEGKASEGARNLGCERSEGRGEESGAEGKARLAARPGKVQNKKHQRRKEKMSEQAKT